MKVSEVTTEYVCNYLRLDDVSDIELAEIEQMQVSAREYIKSYTGLTDEQVDTHEDITTAYLVLIADFFDNRNNYVSVQNNTPNRAVESILRMHSTNLLPE